EEVLEAPLALAESRIHVHLLVEEDAPGGSISDRSALEQAVQQTLRRRFQGAPRPLLEIHANGAGGGAAVLSTIRRKLEERECDAVLLGGVHSDCEPSRLESLSGQHRIYSPD